VKQNMIKWLFALLVVSIVLFLGVSHVFSQSLSDILGRAENNYKNFNQDFRDIAIIFDANIHTPEGEMFTEMKLFLKGEKSRSETLIQLPAAKGMPKGMGSMLVVVIFDGQDTWMISPFVGKKKLTAVQAEEQMHYQTGINWWKFISDKTKYAGIENIGGRDCYLLELEIERKSPYEKIWVDKDTLFLVQAEGVSSDGDNVRTIFSDFRKIESHWQLPYKVEVLMNEAQMMTVLTKSLKMNKGIPDELFDVNKVEMQGPNLQDMIQNMMVPGGKN